MALMVGVAKNESWRLWNDKLQTSQPESLRLFGISETVFKIFLDQILRKLIK